MQRAGPRPRSRRQRPGRAFEPCGLPDLPGLDFIWPKHPRMIRHGTTAWTLHPGTLRGRKPPANSGKARYSTDGTRYCCSESSARSCYGWTSGALECGGLTPLSFLLSFVFFLAQHIGTATAKARHGTRMSQVPAKKEEKKAASNRRTPRLKKRKRRQTAALQG